MWAKHSVLLPCVWNTSAQPRYRGWRRSRSSTFNCPSRLCSREPATSFPCNDWATCSCPTQTRPIFIFFGKPAERPRSHHLHVCEAGSGHEFRHLAVRDFLREHSDEAAIYAALKHELVKRHPQDRLAYMAGKEHYVTELEGRAVVWARRRLRLPA